jgi:hypothetical protein
MWAGSFHRSISSVAGSNPSLAYCKFNFKMKKIQNQMLWKKTTPNDGSGFCPILTLKMSLRRTIKH